MTYSCWYLSFRLCQKQLGSSAWPAQPRNETKRNETKRNETKRNETTFSSTFPHASPEPVLAKMIICSFRKLLTQNEPFCRTWLRNSFEKTGFFGVYPMFVPSLSW
jgi:hypothetical protein